MSASRNDCFQRSRTAGAYCAGMEPVKPDAKGLQGIVGEGLHRVAVHGGTWLALVAWQPGAFALAARTREALDAPDDDRIHA